MNMSDFSRPSARDNVTGMSTTTDQLSAKFNAFKSKFSDFVSQRRRHAGYGVFSTQDDVVCHAVHCLFPSESGQHVCVQQFAHVRLSSHVPIVQMSSAKGSWRTKTPMTAAWAAALGEATPGRCQGLSTRQLQDCHLQTLAAAATREQPPVMCPHKCDLV